MSDPPQDDRATSSDGLPRRIVYFRWLVVAAQAVSIIVTWPLWQVRPEADGATPPNLPLLPMWQFDVGWLLLASLAVVLVRPLPGVMLHTLLLLWTFMQDQVRVQPEFVSLAILMWGTLPMLAARYICRAHLLSLWSYSGLHKLLSTGYWSYGGRLHWQKIFPRLADTPATVFGLIVAGGEVLLALLAFMPRTRPIAARLACLLHLGIFGYLASIGWNEAVWAWNVALAEAGFAFIAAWQEPWRRTIRRNRFAAHLVALLLVVLPAGFYFGLTDPYLSHCLYSNNTSNMRLQRAGERFPPDKIVSLLTFKTLRVPIPPRHWLYEHYAQRVCQAGDRVIVYDPRRWARRRNMTWRTLTLDGEYRGTVKNEQQKHGLWIERFPSGEPAGRGAYRRGKKEGPWIIWRDDGGKAGEGSYRNGLEEGHWTYYKANGDKESEGLYRQGKPSGPWRVWNDQGEPEEVDFEGMPWPALQE